MKIEEFKKKYGVRSVSFVVLSFVQMHKELSPDTRKILSEEIHEMMNNLQSVLEKH